MILDVDLDFWATVSPGAETIMETVLDGGQGGFDEFTLGSGASYGDLGVLYHLVWNYPKLGVDYLRRGDVGLRDRADSIDFSHVVDRRLGVPGGERPEPKRGASALSDALAEVMDQGRRIPDARRRAALDFAAALPGARQVSPLSHKQTDAIQAFLDQPYHAPARQDLAEELIFSIDDTWKPILRDLPPPALVNLIRSPGYVPKYALHDIECHVLSAISIVYRTLTIFHEDRVDPGRTRCWRRPPFDYRLISS